MTELHASYKVVDRQIGLLGGTVLLIGTVIGMSVFLLPGELIGEAGPSIIYALMLTAIPMVFSVLLLLQLGGALPVAGGIYVYASRLVSPFWGFITIWLVIPAIWSVLLFTAIGFAQFSNVLLPFNAPEPLLVAGVLLVFILLNLRGITLVAWVQLVMVAAILLGFLGFIVPGLFQIEAANYTPVFPAGIEPFVLAIVSLYIPFQGFSMIVELGEELKDPIKNIPRVLILGMGIAVLLSLLLVVVFVGLDSWDVLGAYEQGGVAEAASDYLAPGIGVLVAVVAILGAFTTLNALITSYSRTLMRAARDEVLSPKMADIHPKTQVPHRAILVLTIPPLLLAPLELAPVLLSVFLALIILFGSFVSSFALWNLPKRYPEAYEHSIYKLPMWLLKLTAIGSALASLIFWLAIFVQAAPIIVGILVIAVAGYGYYRFRRWRYAKDGIDLDARLSLLHAQESEDAGVTTPVPDELTPELVDATGPPATPAASEQAPPPPRKIAVRTPPPSQRPRPVARPAERGTGNGRDTETLAGIKGLGPAKARALLERFDSVEAIRDADVAELTEVPGVGEKLARTIKDGL